MRDKIMTDQLHILEEKRLAPSVSYDGLRKVENLPTDIRKSSEDLFLPPLFSDKARNPELRPGIQFTNERQGGFAAPKNARKAPFEPLAALNAPPTRNSGNKLSEYYNVRNRYYRGNSSSQAGLRDQNLKLGIRAPDPRRQLVPAALSNPQLRYQAPSSAYVPMRVPSAAKRNPSGNLPPVRREQFGHLSKSPYVRQFQEYALDPSTPPKLQQTYAPMTKEDFTLEALQQRKLALQRLNEKIKGL